MMSVFRTLGRGALALSLITGAGAIVYSALQPELKPSIIADFDGDGKKDALCRRGDDELVIAYSVNVSEKIYGGYEVHDLGTRTEGSPKPGIVAGARYLDGESARVSVGDFNRDGNPDISISKSEDIGRYCMTVSWYGFLGNGKERFGFSMDHTGWTIESRPLRLGRITLY